MWFRTFTIEELNNWPTNNIIGLLGIKYVEITENTISATMPVDERTHQPYGILHGGASVVLAESLGSILPLCALIRSDLLLSAWR